MSKPIFQVIDALPAKNMTTRVLGALDWVVPGQWKNVVGFENTIKVVSGEDDPKLIQKIGERAIALYNDKSQGYQSALWLYQMVDTLQGMAGWTAMASKLGESFNLLSFLNKLTPKSETTQSIDFCVKLVVELVTFTKINGLPGDSFADFVKSLTNYRDEALIRMAALDLSGRIPAAGTGLPDQGAVLLRQERFGRPREERALPAGQVHDSRRQREGPDGLHQHGGRCGQGLGRFVRGLAQSGNGQDCR